MIPKTVVDRLVDANLPRRGLSSPLFFVFQRAVFMLPVFMLLGDEPVI